MGLVTSSNPAAWGISEDSVQVYACWAMSQARLILGEWRGMRHAQQVSGWVGVQPPVGALSCSCWDGRRVTNDMKPTNADQRQKLSVVTSFLVRRHRQQSVLCHWRRRQPALPPAPPRQQLPHYPQPNVQLRRIVQ
jgi:hypothetical protein